MIPKILLLGENGNINLVFLEPECYRYCRVECGDLLLEGLYHPLKEFASLQQGWNDISVQTTQKELEIVLNNRSIFTEKYTRSMGKLKTIIIRFYGCGAIQKTSINNKLIGQINDHQLNTKQDHH
ncbi:MAG: hypothetical protein HC906_06210 [Bacteroidales bacterium]|nr:hypothetical protein [Bacteroidales bacterium]